MADDTTRTGIIPVGGAVAAPIHDRSVGGLIGTLLAFGIIHFSGLTLNDGQAAAVYGSTATLGTMLGAILPDVARPWIQAVLGVLAAVVGAGVLSGCTTMDTRPKAACLQAEGALLPVAIAADAALHTDKLSPQVVTTIQAVAAVAKKAADACRDMPVNATALDASESIGTLQQAIIQIPALTATAFAPEVKR